MQHCTRTPSAPRKPPFLSPVRTSATGRRERTKISLHVCLSGIPKLRFECPIAAGAYVNVNGISTARLMNRPIVSTRTRKSTSSRDEKIRRKNRTKQTNENVWSADHYQIIYVYSYAKYFSAVCSRSPFLLLRQFAQHSIAGAPACRTRRSSRLGWRTRLDLLAKQKMFIMDPAPI